MTVLRVIQNRPDVSLETRQRITETMEQLGFVPHRKVRNKAPRTTLLGLLTPDVGTLPMGAILRGVSRATEHWRYGLALYSQRTRHSGTNDPGKSGKTAKHYLLSFETAGVAGVLLIYPRDYENIIRGLKERNLPFVIIDHQLGTIEEPGVSTSNRKGILDAMRHLLALGHRRIGFITGTQELVASHERLQGYRDGLAEIGLPFDPELVREGDYTQPTGFQQSQALLESAQPPTAIVASNDMMAFGVMDAAKLRGLTIGRDISITGFDDIFQASQSYPALTTVRQPLEEMGQSAAELLVALIEGSSPPLSLHRELPTELIVRDTTGFAPQA
jgi:LacI family transcriptional regulator